MWLRHLNSWVTEQAGHSVAVLLRVYAKRIADRTEDARRPIEDATKPSKKQGKIKLGLGRRPLCFPVFPTGTRARTC
jgi:hypothetical protein